MIVMGKAAVAIGLSETEGGNWSRWCGRRRPGRRWHAHFTPTGVSWINQVERFFALITDKQIRRGVHR